MLLLFTNESCQGAIAHGSIASGRPGEPPDRNLSLFPDKIQTDWNFFTNLHDLLLACPTRYSWSHRNQLTGGARFLRRLRKWSHRWYCRENTAIAPGLHGGQRAGTWHHQSQWQRHIRLGKTRKQRNRHLFPRSIPNPHEAEWWDLNLNSNLASSG